MAQIGKERSERASEFGLSAPPRLIQDIEYVNGPNEIPPNWRWVSLSSLLLHDHGGKTPSKNNPRFWGGEVPWASVKDLNDEGALSKTQDTITKQALDESGVPLVPAGNIIVCVRMAIGRIAINQMDVAINQDLRAFYLPKAINKAYFILAYRTLQIEGSGMTVKGVRKKDLHDVPFPLPPTAEQHRIVAQVDHLLAQADELAARLAAAETQRRR
ncbi:restriction endonuclease subunit S, partial [Promineifilum sp.]|uniref:restriction endonuclease subunit S n=1 Tax=Promineifilum sp. TaxID=2664178 RepID=UPI0035B049D7